MAAGLLAVVVVLAIVGFGYLYTSILPRWEKVATINGVPISASYYAKLLRLTAGPSGRDPSLLAPLVMQQAIESELIRQRAPVLGLSVTPQEIAEYLQVPAEPSPDAGQASAEERFRSYLHQVGFSPQELRWVAEANLLQKKALDYLMEQVFLEAEQAHLFAIRVDEEEQAGQVLERLEAGEEFADLAQELSTELGSKDTGGDLGWVPRGIIDWPELEEAAFSLELDTLSQPIATPTGFYIIRVEGREQREVDAGDREYLQVQAWQQWLEEQWASSQIEESVTSRGMSWATSRASR
jgi:foldase protein PrsA